MQPRIVYGVYDDVEPYLSRRLRHIVPSPRARKGQTELVRSR